MSRIFTVVNAFGDYRRGDQITDATKIADLLQAGLDVNGVMAEAPEPAPALQASGSSKSSDPSAD